jgi:hypothetical protein
MIKYLLNFISPTIKLQYFKGIPFIILSINRAEPFRKTQTRISSRIREHETPQTTWEDLMDKTFENITLFAQTKKMKVQENLEV